MITEMQSTDIKVDHLKTKTLEVVNLGQVEVEKVILSIVPVSSSPPSPTTPSNSFASNGGEQNIAQGTSAIGQQINNYGVPHEDYKELAGKLKVTEFALSSFFKILEEEQVPLSDLDSKLREIAAQHKELLLRLETVQSEDPQVVKLKGETRKAIEVSDYAKAEELLNLMELREFVEIALRDIFSGTKDAQKQILYGDIIPKKDKKTGETDIEFEIAIKREDNKICVITNSALQNPNMSKVKFTIPVRLPDRRGGLLSHLIEYYLIKRRKIKDKPALDESQFLQPTPDATDKEEEEKKQPSAINS